MAKRKTRRLSRRSARAGRRKMLLEGWWQKLSAESKRQALRFCVHVVLLALVAAGVYYGLRSAERYVRRLDRYTGPIEVMLADEPAWLASYPRVREQLLNEATTAMRGGVLGPSEGTTPDWFDETLAQRVAARIRDNAYIARVVQVDRQLVRAEEGEGNSAFSRRVVLRVEFRRPLAQIWLYGTRSWRAYVLDEHGHVLEKRMTAAADLPQITNFALPLRDIYVGRPLEVDGIKAGLEVLGAMVDQPYFREIRALDVGNFGRRDPRRSELLIVVSPPTAAPGASLQEIGWGLRIGSPDYHIEYNDTERKLQILYSIWKQYGTLNLRQGPYDLFSKKDKPYCPQSGGNMAGFSLL